MKRGQVIALALAGACGLGAVMLANSFMRRPPPPAPVKVVEKPETIQVLVARSDIGLGQVAAESSLRWQDWPKDAVVRGFVTRQAKPQAIVELSGTIARLPITAGEPINEQKLVRAGSGGVLAAILRPGMRAVSVKIDERIAAGRLILPNDHVDILHLKRDRKSGSEDERVETLLSNIRVLAIGQLIETRDGKRSAEGATATLELTPDHAERLALASSAGGEIILALRSVADIAEAPAEEKERAKTRTSEHVHVIRYGVKSKVSVAP